MKMTPNNTSTADAQKVIRRCVRLNLVSVTRHARERMAQRGIDASDVLAALSTGSVIGDRTEPENWLVIGDVTVAVALYSTPETVVLTVMH